MRAYIYAGYKTVEKNSMYDVCLRISPNETSENISAQMDAVPAPMSFGYSFCTDTESHPKRMNRIFTLFLAYRVRVRYRHYGYTYVSAFVLEASKGNSLLIIFA